MKIDGMSPYPVFRKSSVNGSASVKPSQQTKAAAKTDIVDFSRGQTAVPDKDFQTLKASIVADISAPANPQKMEELKESLQNGYRPSTDAVVDAILGLEKE